MNKVQNLVIKTKNDRLIGADLQELGGGCFQGRFEMHKLLHSKGREDVLIPTPKGTSPEEAYENLLKAVTNTLKIADPEDIVQVVDNVCNAELCGVASQSRVLGQKVSITVNGIQLLS